MSDTKKEKPQRKPAIGFGYILTGPDGRVFHWTFSTSRRETWTLACTHDSSATSKEDWTQDGYRVAAVFLREKEKV